MFRLETTVAIAFLVVMIVAFTMLIVTKPFTKGRIYIEEVGFRTRGIDTLEYLANIYIDGARIGGIYMIVPTYNETRPPLRIHLSLFNESVVKSLKLVFNPPLGKVMDLAWVATTYNIPIKYYQEGASIVWQCDNMGIYGKGAITLDFIPQYPTPGYYSGITITTNIVLEYKNNQYAITHNVLIR